MFQSVIEHWGWFRTGRVGTGAVLSLLAHAAVLGAVLLLSGRTVEETPEPIKDTGPLRLVAPPRGNPHPVVATQLAPRPRKPRKDRVPRQVQPPPVQQAEPVKDVTPEAPSDAVAEPSDLPYIPGSHPDGVDFGGVAGAALPPVLATLGQATGEEVLPFGESMTRPELLSDPGIELPHEAVRARVEGTVIVKCVITRQGEVDGCRVIKGLAFVDGAVVSALEARRYRPVTFQGRAVSVSYTFNVHIRQPR